MQLFLVRHASHADVGRRLTGRAPGAPLTPAGEAEARALAHLLAAEGLDEVQASPRTRTLVTAQAIADAAGCPLAVVPALDEVDFGAWEGRAFADLAGDPLWDDWNRRRSAARPPGGEAMAEAADRIESHARHLARTRGGERIALVTHADMIRALVLRLERRSLDAILSFEVAPASLTRVALDASGARVLGLNETAGIAA